MADNKRRGRFGKGSDDAGQSIFDLFEPPPEQESSSFGKIPIIRDDDDSLDLTDVEFVEAKAAAEAEAAGLAHWTEPATGQVPAALAADMPEGDPTEAIKGPSWRGEDPNWAGPDLSDVFADTAAITHDRIIDLDDDDELSVDPSPTPPPRSSRRPSAAASSRPEAPSVFDRPAPNQAVSPPARRQAPVTSPPPPAAGAPPRRASAAVPPPTRGAAPAGPKPRRSAPVAARRERPLLDDATTERPVERPRATPAPPPAPPLIDESLTAPPAVRDQHRGAHDLHPDAPSGGFDTVPERAPLPERPSARPAPERILTTDDPADLAAPGDLGGGAHIDADVPADIDEYDDEDLDYYDEYEDGDDEDGGGGGRSLGQSVVVGIALVAVVFVTLGLGAVPTMVLIGVLTLLAVMELFNAMRVAGLRPATLLGLVGAVALPAATYVRGDAGYPLVVGLAVVFGMLWYLTGADTERPVLNLGLTLTGIMWIGGLAGFGALMLRADDGVGLLLATIIITAMSDTLAYLGGRAYGTKSFHSASPNKTWEGTLTGFFGALFAGLVIGVTDFIAVFDQQFISVMVLAAVVGILAPVGDLAESLVKRDLGIKDMGTLLPGHGGVLDRVDGLLFALPGAYYVAVVFTLI